MIPRIKYTLIARRNLLTRDRSLEVTGRPGRPNAEGSGKDRRAAEVDNNDRVANDNGSRNVLGLATQEYRG